MDERETAFFAELEAASAAAADAERVERGRHIAAMERIARRCARAHRAAVDRYRAALESEV